MSRATPLPRSPILLPALLVVVGTVLLIGNFSLIGIFDVGSLAFLLLVILGVGILLRGDAAPSTEARTFGITRGSVESASLVVNASDIDILIEALASQERLISGQYAYNARPSLNVQGTHAVLMLDRAHTSLLTFADWTTGLAQAMPWTIQCSTSVGQIDADLNGLIIDQAAFYSGTGSIRLVAPQELLGEPIVVHSVLGNLHIQTPLGCHVQITAQKSRFFKVHADTARYALHDDNQYIAHDPYLDAPLIHIIISSSFGDAYLS